MEEKSGQHEKENGHMEEKAVSLDRYLQFMKASLIQNLRNIPLPTTNEVINEDNFDSYIAQLRAMCLENYTAENSAIFNAVKQALNGINLL